MPKMKEITCACGCGRKKMVRDADIKRGWGKFYNKSCKAKEQERRTNTHKKYLSKAHTICINESDYATQFENSTARTNNLICNSCNKRIKKGTKIIFELLGSKMLNCFCDSCAEAYEHEVILDSMPTFSS